MVMGEECCDEADNQVTGRSSEEDFHSCCFPFFFGTICGRRRRVSSDLYRLGISWCKMKPRRHHLAVYGRLHY